MLPVVATEKIRDEEVANFFYYLFLYHDVSFNII